MKKYNLVIPAAGSARRLRPLTNCTPKNLLTVGDRAILDWQLDMIPLNRISEIIIIVGFQKEKIIRYVKSKNISIPISFYHNAKYKDTNCAYSLLSARELLINGFILLNNDLLLQKANFLKIIDAEKNNVAGVRKVESYITDLQKVNIVNNKITNWANSIDNYNGEIMGPLKICANDAKKVIKYYDSLSYSEKVKLHCFSLFSRLLGEIEYYPIYFEDGSWIEIDTASDLKIARQIFA